MRVMPSGTEQLARRPRPTTGRRAAAPPPRRAARSRGCCSGSTPPRPATRPGAVVGGEQRVHGRPRVSAPTTSRPARSASRRRARAGRGPSPRRTRSPGRTSRSGRRATSRPSSRSRITSDGDEGLGDRADPVLRVVGRAGHVAGTADPRHGDPRSARRPRPTAAGRGPGSAPDGSAGRSLGERLDRRARADQVAVAVRLVDAGDGRPVLVGVLAGREHAELALVGPLPLLDERPRGVRRVAQR